jgi:hypothetical protein
MLKFLFQLAMLERESQSIQISFALQFPIKLFALCDVEIFYRASVCWVVIQHGNMTPAPDFLPMIIVINNNYEHVLAVCVNLAIFKLGK